MCGEGIVIEVGVGGVDDWCIVDNVLGWEFVCIIDGEREFEEEMGWRYNGVDNFGVNYVLEICLLLDDDVWVRVVNDDIDEEVGDGVLSIWLWRGWIWCDLNCIFSWFDMGVGMRGCLVFKG